ncbi:MAG TPA: response regulator [Rhodanobacteraceae bacterium]|nr:response regulator [Rhodanobacteraceae bacterium]
MARPGAELLVVDDDEAFVAHLALILIDSGYKVLGPATNVPDALRLLRDAKPDAALLDYRLSDSTTEPLLPVLEERGIPVCIVTATLKNELPAAFAGYPVLQKPFAAVELIEEARRLGRR